MKPSVLRLDYTPGEDVCFFRICVPLSIHISLFSLAYFSSAPCPLSYGARQRNFYAMSEPPPPGLEDGDTGRVYEMAAPENAAAGYEYEYGATTSDQLGAGDNGYEEAQQQRDAPAGDIGDDQYQYDDGMRHQPDVSTYGSTSPDMVGSQQQQEQQQQEDDYGEQQYDERGPHAGLGAGHVGEDEEDAYEDPEEMIREFGRHPMMDRVQEALYNQLLQTYERVSEELQDKDADVKK